MASDVQETERTARDRHQLRTLILAVSVLLLVVLAVAAIVVEAGALEDRWFLHFPLLFYLAAQGLLIFIVALGFWYVRAQERIDQSRSDSEELV